MQSKTATKERWDDAELVSCALARDSAAFRMIMETHNRRLYRICGRNDQAKSRQRQRDAMRNRKRADDYQQLFH